MSSLGTSRAQARETLHRVLASLTPVQEPQGAQDLLEAVRTARDIDTEAHLMLQHSVLAAREAGATWKDIGTTLGISKQAAQKRFAAPEKLPEISLDPHERLLGPVSMTNEIAELNLAGQYGWHSVGFGIAHHRVVHSESQWQHCRVMGGEKVLNLASQGWVEIGKSFPYTFMKRNTGAAALSETA